MDGFKKLPKMQCFKEGGSVKSQIAAFEKKESKSEGKKDIAQDKSMIKKGVRQHESALHKGEPKTELKLKTGGRAKKATGTVKKFEKASGEYGAKKTATDKKNIKEAKKFKPAFKEGGKACAPSAAKKAKNKPAKMCGGGMPKYNGKDGSYVDVKDPQKLTDKIAQEENEADANLLPNAYKAVKRVGKQAIKAAKDMFGGQGAVSDAERSNIAKKKGGKVKKFAEGGSTGELSSEEKSWLGGADATDPFILARMRSALGPKKPQGSYIPNANPTMDNRDVGTTSVKPETSADLDPYGVTRKETSRDLDPYGAASKPVVAPVRRAPVRRPMVKPETSADLDPYGVTRKETSADLDPYNAASKPAAPFIDIPKNNPGMKQYGSGQSPLGGMFNRFFNASPSDQAAQFRRGAEQRKKIGKNIGETIGMPKPSDS